jgi:hypothetical protein
MEARKDDSFDRIHFAVLKLSDGNFAQLEEAVHLAQRDWSDLLMAAGFGSDIHAHLKWLPKRKWTP